MVRRLLLLSVLLVAVLVGGFGATQQPADKPGAADEQTLQQAKIPTDEDGLFQFLTSRTLQDADRVTIQSLLNNLESGDIPLRQRTQANLVQRGPLAVPFLKKALLRASPEFVKTLEQTLREIEKSGGTEHAVAAARLLTVRSLAKSATLQERTLQGLLQLLPQIEDEYAEEELLACVARLGLKGSKVAPVLQAALKDASPERRGVAGFVVAQFGNPAQRDQVRSFLADKDQTVNLRIAAGLLGKRTVFSARENVNQALAAFTSAKLPVDQASLVKFLLERTLTEADQQEIRALIQQLNAKSFGVRDQATRKLIARGPLAIPLLRQATEDSALEPARRAQVRIDRIKAPEAPTLPIAAARLLADLPPGKTAEPLQTLLTYFPFADNEAIEEELLVSMSLLSLRQPEIDPTLVKALADPLPLRRAAAGYVLGRVGTEEQRKLVRKLLDDPMLRVRWRVAQGLLAGRDKQAVPTLIELLRLAPTSWLWKVEESLVRLAGTATPSPLVTESVGPIRAKAVAAWADWWRNQADQIDLAVLLREDHILGLYTIAEYDSFNGGGQGKVWECARDGKERWSIRNLFGAMDGQVLPNGNVLVAENSGNRVTERDKKTGNVLWQYGVNNPVACQRLPNGNTFMAGYNQIIELSPNKAVLYNIQRNGYILFGASKLRNGNILYATSTGLVKEVDTTGKEVRPALNIGGNGSWCGAELLPNGRYLVALMNVGEVREIDQTGKVFWKAAFPGVFRATRLPNGNVLAASMTTRHVAVLDRNGARVFERLCDGRPWMVRYR